MNKDSFNNSVRVYDREDLHPREEALINEHFTGRVLDLGCGVGRTTINLHRMGYDVVGVDYAEELVARGREQHPELDLRQGDASKLEFDDNSFDTVFFSYNGIDYLHPPSQRRKALQEIQRVLKNGGVFVCSSHKRFYLDWPLQRHYPYVRIHYLLSQLSSLFGRYRWERHPFGWLKTYCTNDMTPELEDAGFTDITRIDAGYHCYYIAR